MKKDKDRGQKLRLAILWLAILLFSSFWLTVRSSADSVNIVVIPQVPREGEPIIATFKLNNPSSDAMVTQYQFYVNGKLLNQGVTTIAPSSGKTYKYAYESPIQLGEQLTFMVKTHSELGNHEKVVSLPQYPPQIWSSFVSFASFSTSVMSAMSTMSYYNTTFINDAGLNIGIIISIVLIGLLIFLELSQPVFEKAIEGRLTRLKIRFSTVTWILFMIFIGIVFTKVVLILSI